MPELLIIRGVPGSGKTTLAKKIAEAMGYDHFEADQYFEGPDGYHWSADKTDDAHAECQRKTREALAAGRNVVVSNTFVRRDQVNQYRRIAREVGGVNVQVVLAQGNYQNVHGVPVERVREMRRNFEYRI